MTVERIIVDRMTVEPPRGTGHSASAALRLLHGFELRHGERTIPVPQTCQRLLAYLALRGRPVYRSRVIGDLWADAPKDRGSACLRSAMWRTPAPEGRPLILASGTDLALAPELLVDFPSASAWASAVLSGTSGHATPSAAEPLWWNQPKPALHGDLLPDWDEDWIVLDRERFRQLRLHALEAECERLSAAGRFGEALEAGLAALEAEPLRDSARRAVVQVHLREGNVVEALRAYYAYERLLAAELGIGPSSAMRQLLGDLVGAPEPRQIRAELPASVLVR